MNLPRGRDNGLIVEQLPGELLVYDQSRDEAHCLNALAGVVFELADGTREVTTIAALATERTGEPVDQQQVTDILDQLADKGLLEEPLGGQPGLGVSRRQMLRRGAVAGGALAAGAAVSTIVAPVPAFAQTPPPNCVPFGGACTTDSQCCNGVPCTNGRCVFP
jgi:hypothetical protein